MDEVGSEKLHRKAGYDIEEKDDGLGQAGADQIESGGQDDDVED